MKNYVEFGAYYNNDLNGRVKTVCRVTDLVSGEPSIAFVKVNDGGYCSKIYSVPEEQFKTMFDISRS